MHSPAGPQVTGLPRSSRVLGFIAGHWRGLLKAYLAGLVLLVGAAYQRGTDVALARVDRFLDSRINSHHQYLTQAIERYRLIPEIVASSDDVTQLLTRPGPSGVARVNRVLDMLAQHTEAEDIYVLDHEGVVLAANHCGQRKSIIGASYGGRPYFRNAKAGQTGWFMGLGVTRRTIGYYLARPVVVDHVLRGVVAMRLSLEPFNAHLREYWTRNGEIVLLADPRGMVLASPEERWRFHALGSPADNALPPLPVTVAKVLGPRLELVRFADLPGRSFVQKSFDSAALGARIYLYVDAEQYWEPVILHVLAAVLVALTLLCATIVLVHRWMYQNRLVTAELSRRDEALRQSEKRLQTIVDNSDAVIHMKDLAGRYLLANRRFRELALREVVGRSAHELFPEEFARIWAANDQRVIRSGQGDQFDEPIPVAGGVRTYLSAKFPLFDESGAISAICAVSTDITDRKRAEDEIQELNRTLEQRVHERTAELEAAKEAAEAANRTKSEFLATMSHEIRTPIHTIIGATDLALQTGPDARQQGYLANVNAAATALLGVINDILDFSKIEAGKMQIEQVRFDPRDVLARLEAMIGLRARAKCLRFVVRAAPEVPRAVVGDPMRVGQILLNLVDNAVKFTARGEVSVELGCEPGQAHTLRFIVADTGVGITPDNVERVFEPFCQADQSSTQRHGGTGLGLAISKKLTEAMGGSIALHSTPGAGSRFLVRLPFGCPLRATPADTLPVAAAPASTAERSLRGVRVLIAEDNEINRRMTLEILEAQGVVCATAADGVQALAMALAPTASYDLVLMDVRMPDMDGIEAARRIRAAGLARLPIVAMTAHAMDQDVQHCIAAGMDAHLAKPFHPHQLLAAIASHTGRHAPAAASVEPARPAGTALPPALAGFDGLEQALDRVNGNDILLRELLQIFRTRFGDWISALRDALASGDGARAHHMTHALRGAAAALGAGQVAARAGHVEMFIARHGLPVPETMPAALEEALRRALESIAGLPPGVPVVAAPAPRPGRSVSELVGLLDDALAVNSMGAAGLVAQLRHAAADAGGVARLDELGRAVDQLNYRAARAILAAFSARVAAP